MDYILETQGLTKVYGSKEACKDVDLHIREGEIYGLIGRNGAGKTTIMRMISGLSRPTRGSYSIFGKTGFELGKMLKNVGVLIEHPGLYPNLSAYENLKIKCIGMGINKKGYVEEMLKLVGLENVDRKKGAGSYSLGMRQRLGIGLALIGELVEAMRADKRTPQPLSQLVIGLKCGGSDGFSGITANPLLGALSDGVCAAGGTALLSEVPEMFGAETILMNRCRDEATFNAAVELINGYKRYFMRYGQEIYENPSPGNKAGGITTLEDKSLGCTQKGGTGPVEGVLNYAEPVQRPGLNLVYGPGNDICAVTGLMAAGAQLILFTTGRGTPLGAPVPTLKVATNSALAAKKANWIDFNAGQLLEGLTMSEAAQALLRLVLDTASGKKAQNELHGYREIAIFKDGVTL